MLVEICANSYKSAINAQKAGAHRIELCSELAVGGITPSYGLIQQIMKNITLPVFVLIRPRSGNFTYSESEFKIMKQNILLCKNSGCKGIVSGVLNTNDSIDIKRTQELITIAKPMLFTFHRAFDSTHNPMEALEQLIEVKVDSVLTSGQETSAEKGIELLKRLKKIGGSRITILPGGGINVENAHLFKEAGFSEIHCSASTIYQRNKTLKVPMNSIKFFDETIEAYSDIEKIKSILKVIENEA